MYSFIPLFGRLGRPPESCQKQKVFETFERSGISLAKLTGEFEFKRGKWPHLQTSSNETSSSSRISDFQNSYSFDLTLVWLSPLGSLNSNVPNDSVYRFRPMKPVPPQDSRIFRIYILLNFNILSLEAYRFQNSEGLRGLKEYALKVHCTYCKKLSVIIPGYNKLWNWQKKVCSGTEY